MCVSRNIMYLTLGVVALSLPALGSVQAGCLYHDTIARKDDIVSCLTTNTGVVSKGLGLSSGVVAKGVAVTPTISLGMVHFAFNSADLLPDARTQLDEMGQALQSPRLKNSAMRVIGHTDAVGSDAYNLALSEQRAIAVVRYLETAWHVAPRRLNAEGRGERELIDPQNPTSGTNRRVELQPNG